MCCRVRRSYAARVRVCVPTSDPSAAKRRTVRVTGLEEGLATAKPVLLSPGFNRANNCVWVDVALGRTPTSGSFWPATVKPKNSVAVNRPVEDKRAQPVEMVGSLLTVSTVIAEFGTVPAKEAQTEAKRSVPKAILLNDNLGEAYALLGALQGVFEFDWAGGDRSFQRALDLSPGSVPVLRRHAWHRLVSALQFDEAINEMRQAEAQDPLSPLIHMWFGLVYLAARDYRRAAEQCRVALELADGLHPARWFLGTALIFQRKPDAAVAECRRVYEAWGGHPMVTGGMILVYGLTGLGDEARSLSDELFRTARSTPVPPTALAWAYLGLQDDRVFEWLEKATDGRDPAITHLGVMPMYDGIRQDSRFRNLLSKMGLDEDQSSA